MKEALYFRIFLALSIALVGGAMAAVVASLPRDGRVVGVCLDRQTHLPVKGVTILLSKDNHEDARYDSSISSHTPDVYPDNSSPAGWTQSSSSDSDLGMAGASADDREEWASHSDDQGIFHFGHVPPGIYSLRTDSDDHDEVDQSVVVAEGSNPQLDLRMRLSAARLSFDNPTLNWYPGEYSRAWAERSHDGANHCGETGEGRFSGGH